MSWMLLLLLLLFAVVVVVAVVGCWCWCHRCLRRVSFCRSINPTLSKNTRVARRRLNTVDISSQTHNCALASAAVKHVLN